MRLPRIDEFAPRKQDFSWMKYEPNTGLKNHQNSLLIHGSCFNEYLSTSTLLTLLLHDHWMIIFQSRYCRRWRIEACPHQCYPDASPGSNWWITAVNSFPWHRRNWRNPRCWKRTICWVLGKRNCHSNAALRYVKSWLLRLAWQLQSCQFAPHLVFGLWCQLNSNSPVPKGMQKPQTARNARIWLYI